MAIQAQLNGTQVALVEFRTDVGRSEIDGTEGVRIFDRPDFAILVGDGRAVAACLATIALQDDALNEVKASCSAQGRSTDISEATPILFQYSRRRGATGRSVLRLAVRDMSITVGGETIESVLESGVVS